MHQVREKPKLSFWQVIGRIAFFLFLAAATVIVAWGILHTVRNDQKVARLAHQPIPVETVRSKVMTMQEVIGAAGALRSNELANITARVAQRIDSTPADLGMIKRKGEVLMTFDTRTLRAALESAEHLFAYDKVTEENATSQLKRIQTLFDQTLASALDLEAAKATLAQAEANVASGALAVALAKLDIENSTVLAPVDCVILARQVNAGESTLVGQVTFNLGTLDYVLLIAQVAEERVYSLSLDLPCEVGFDSYPGEIFKGVVAKIDPTTTPTNHAFPALIRIPNPELRLKPGLTGFARIFHQKMTLAVPSVAIMNPVGDHATLFVISDDRKAHLRDVRTGIVAAGYTEILFGLNENERVVTVGQLWLRDNDNVPAQKN